MISRTLWQRIMLSENVKTLKENIARCGNGRNITVVAATKTVAPEIISTLPSLGITIAGENKVQELLSKYEAVQGVTWHFIGRLQRNKVKYIVDKVSMIQSVDSVPLADEIEHRCAKIDRIMDVLVEVNAGEEAKGGVSPGGLMDLCDYISSLPHLRLKGIMCVLPIGATESMYEDTHSLFMSVINRYDGADILSMGMSGDYETAIRHGATMIRTGSCLFGQRVYNK